MRRRKRTRERRLPLRLAILGVVGFVALIWLSPLQGLVQRAILLGPDSLFPAPVTRRLMVRRAGHRVVVFVRSGVVYEGLSFRSAALSWRPEPYCIYLPPGYYDRTNRLRRYPVLYLLHGAPGQPSDWIDGMHVQVLEDQGIAAGALRPMIVVMPEGNGGLWQDSQYVNTSGGFRAEDLIAHDVVRYVDAHYRTIPDRRARAIAGISEGAYGAMNLGLKHLDTFGTIVSISGYFSADPAEVLVGNDPWGRDRALRIANSPTLYVRWLSGPRNTVIMIRDTAILIMDNTSDGGYTEAARHFDRALSAAHIPHTLVLQSGFNPLVAHYWPYWHQAFPQALIFISRHLSSMARHMTGDYDVPPHFIESPSGHIGPGHWCAWPGWPCYGQSRTATCARGLPSPSPLQGCIGRGHILRSRPVTLQTLPAISREGRAMQDQLLGKGIAA